MKPQTLHAALLAGTAGRTQCVLQSFVVNDITNPTAVTGCCAAGAIYIATFGAEAAIALMQEFHSFEQETVPFEEAFHAELVKAWPALGQSGEPLARLHDPEFMDDLQTNTMLRTLMDLNDYQGLSNQALAELLRQLGH